MQPNEEKVVVTRNAEQLQNASEMRWFLALVQHLLKFRPDFAEVAEPLRKLTRKDQCFVWGEEQRNLGVSEYAPCILTDGEGRVGILTCQHIKTNQSYTSSLS